MKKPPVTTANNLGTLANKMKAIIFDLGRVLVHYDPIATLAGVQDLVDIPAARLRALMLTVERPFGTGQINGEAFYRQLIQETGLQATWEEFTAVFCRSQARNETALAYAGALAERPSVKVGVISNTNEIHANWLYKNLPELELFTAVLLSHQVGLLKPDPAIYRLALERLGVSAAQALFVDDVMENVVGAQNVGLAGHHHTDWGETETVIENWRL